MFFAVSTCFAQQQWLPVTAAELDQKTPLVEPDADAEAIFWEVSVDDKDNSKLSYEHYVRVKIFTDRGREKFAKFDIPYFKDKKVENVAARVVRPDGTMSELQSSDIFDREIVRAEGKSYKAKSFAVPNIAPGVILEYQYREVFKNDSAGNDRLYFQRDIPVQRITYRVRPNGNLSLGFTARNMSGVRFLRNKDGFFVASRENVPAFKEEPNMPPEEEVKQFVSLSYDQFGGILNWAFFGRAMGGVFDKWTEDQKDVADKARQIVEGAQSDDEKLQRLYEYAQKQIRNTTYDRTMTDEQRRNVKTKNASDTLKRGAGSSYEIDMLFASMARSLGFDANEMMSGNRSQKFFNYERDINYTYIHHSGIAIRLGEIWKPFNPGVPYMPAGMTYWHDELVSTLVAGQGNHLWIKLPAFDQNYNSSKRTGRFKLLEDGTLEGTVRVEHSGHQALERRGATYQRSVAEREELLTKTWLISLPTAEISAVAFENFDDQTKPYVYTFKVRVPAYAQKTGKRLFVQPGFFEYGARPRFSSETRVYPIHFEFPWSEEDDVEIALPPNVELEAFTPPEELKEGSGMAGDRIAIEFAKESNTLKYRRSFFFGAKGRLVFPATAYKPLKQLFDVVNKLDTRAISIKPKQ